MQRARLARRAAYCKRTGVPNRAIPPSGLERRDKTKRRADVPVLLEVEQANLPLDQLQRESAPPPIESQDERTDEMNDSKEHQQFRIWMALGTVAVYIFLVVTGNA